MKTLTNLGLGAVLAAVCLVPAAGSDAARMLSGQPLPSVHTVDAGRLLPSLDEAASVVRSAFPHLFASASAHLAARPQRQ